jgi:hypothetical protein
VSALESASEDASAIIIYSGLKPGFSAGGDLRELYAYALAVTPAERGAGIRASLELSHRLCTAIDASPHRRRPQLYCGPKGSLNRETSRTVRDCQEEALRQIDEWISTLTDGARERRRSRGQKNLLETIWPLVPNIQLGSNSECVKFPVRAQSGHRNTLRYRRSCPGIARPDLHSRRLPVCPYVIRNQGQLLSVYCRLLSTHRKVKRLVNGGALMGNPVVMKDHYSA